MGSLKRAVGAMVLGVAALGASALLLVVSRAGHNDGHEPSETLVLGVWRVLYDGRAPALWMVLAAVGAALVCAGAVVVFEGRVVARSRRSDRSQVMPLAPRVVMAQTRGRYAGPVTVTALIPAHNEAGRIRATLAALRAQSRPPDRVVVVADNCTDYTENIALMWGVEVFRTVGNTHKKAGALNQALAVLLPDQGENDAILVMDADTVLDEAFVESAARRMTDDRALMAVGGLFYGEDGGGLLGQFQRNEYARYSRDLRRRRGRVFVLTGTASVFRPRALRTVASERGLLLPGRPGDVFDTVVLTEDNELTLALKSLGALMVSPHDCSVVTELMPTWKALWAQRLRWQRGGLENLADYGVRPQTFRYWIQQLGIGYGVIALASYLTLVAVMALALDVWVWFPFWIGAGLVFAVERVLTVWSLGWPARALALLVLPELAYAMFLSVVFVKGAADISMDRPASWQHVVAADDQVDQVRVGV